MRTKKAKGPGRRSSLDDSAGEDSDGVGSDLDRLPDDSSSDDEDYKERVYGGKWVLQLFLPKYEAGTTCLSQTNAELAQEYVDATIAAQQDWVKIRDRLLRSPSTTLATLRAALKVELERVNMVRNYAKNAFTMKLYMREYRRKKKMELNLPMRQPWDRRGYMRAYMRRYRATAPRLFQGVWH